MATPRERISAWLGLVVGDIRTLYRRSVPAGGSAGQVLTKSSGTDYALAWQTPPYVTDPYYTETEIGDIRIDFVGEIETRLI